MSGFSIWNLNKIRLVCLQQLSQSPSLCQSSQRAVVRACIYCCAVLDTGHASKHLVLTVFIIMERLLIFIVAVVIIISCIFVFSRDVILSTKHSLSLNGRRAEKERATSSSDEDRQSRSQYQVILLCIVVVVLEELSLSLLSFLICSV